MKIEVVFAVDRSADADLNEAPAVHKSFFDGAAEWRAVKILAAEVLIPGVDVGVELDQSERPMPLCERAEDRQ